MQDSASFWTDIKKLEEQLAKSPESYCFARLSEIYLKVGLIDDALHVARQGIETHPGYISGHRAFSQACYAKGLNNEAIDSLKIIVEAIPEDISSQKLYGRLLLESGNNDVASRAFRTVLEFEPDNVECRIELESLDRMASDSGIDLDSSEEIYDDLEIIEELELIDDELDESEASVEPYESDFLLETPAESFALDHDPLSTRTLAELYVKQGFIHKALEIYRALLSENPANCEIAAKINELEKLENSENCSTEEPDYADDLETSEEQAAEILPAIEFQDEPVIAEQAEVMAVLDKQPTPEEIVLVDAAAEVPKYGTADNAVAELERWLENIRRIRSCH